jgi:hypothetical protein
MVGYICDFLKWLCIFENIKKNKKIKKFGIGSVWAAGKGRPTQQILGCIAYTTAFRGICIFIFLNKN